MGGSYTGFFQVKAGSPLFMKGVEAGIGKGLVQTG